MDSPVAYTNRKGTQYFLHCKLTKNGKPRYVFARKVGEGPLNQIPEGFEISESVNGTVSLRRCKPKQITDLEMEQIERVLRNHLHLQGCIYEVKDRTVVIYQSSGPVPITPALEGFLGAEIFNVLQRHKRFEPVMRFVLVDEEKRLFTVDRMCYRSSIDGWLSLHRNDKLAKLAHEYLPHVGRETFYEMI